MLVERGNYRHCYEIIRRDGYQTPILIYVSTSDVDALCAYRILKSMFKSDNVPFSVFPVSGSEELRKRGKEIPDDEQNRAIVLINCGGTEDVREMMDLKVNCRAYVLDSHRPLSLQNVSEENKDVYVIRDDSKEGDDYFPEMDTDSEEDDDDEKNEDEAESDFSSDDDDDEEETARRKQIKLDRQRERQSQREAQQPESPRTVALRRKKRQAERVEYWRRGSYYGRSAGLCAFDMAFDMKKEGLEKNLLLWLAIVSLTDQLAHQKVSQETYKQYCFQLMSQVSNQINGNMHQERALDDGTMVKVFEDRKISIEVEELRFEMMRHWNLYDAMLHSPYVVTRLQTWKESGVHLLDSLLATCGLSLQEAKQKFSHMSPNMEKQMREKLKEHAGSHGGLHDLTYWSFTYHHGFKVKMSAMDVVYAATAILENYSRCDVEDDEDEKENEENINTENDMDIRGNSNNNRRKSVGGGGDEEDGTPESSAAAFWTASKVLSLSNWEETSNGLQRAMRVQRALIRQGGFALSNKGSIKTLGSLRYFSLTEHGSPADVDLFKHPLTLLRLALFLQDALRQVKKVLRPLIVVGPSMIDPNYFLVVGVTEKPQTDSIESGGNFFMQSYARAAEQVRAHTKHGSFEGSVVQVAKTDLPEFLESLSDIDAERVARQAYMRNY